MRIASAFDDEDRRRGVEEGRLPPATIAEYFYKLGFDEAILHNQLLHKFQTLDAASEARLRAATREELDRYLERALTAGSLAAVFAD